MNRRFAGLFLLPCLLAPAALAQDAPDGINLRNTVTVQIVKRTKDAVVNISARKIVEERISPFGNDPFMQGMSQLMRVPANSLGSGFIVHPDGYVVTNNHVIDRARQITVELADGRKFNAELISADAEADLAVLKISATKPLPVLELGDSSDLMIGEPAIAVGNPFGFTHTVSTGIVSALHRNLNNVGGNETLGDLIQTDAAINPGNSGGPLLNAYGQVIGINTAIRSDAQNIGFAIQVNRLRDLIPELMSPEHVTKTQIPISFKEKIQIAEPATVTSQVVSGDNDAKTVRSINGIVPKDIVDAYAVLLRAKAGDEVRVDWQGGGHQTVTAVAVPTPDAVVQARKKLGLDVEQMTPMLAGKYRSAVEDGLLVTGVLREGIASKGGVEPGDVIVQLGRYNVSTMDDLSALMQYLPDNGQVRIRVVRGNRIGFLTLSFGTAADSNDSGGA